MKYIGTFIAFLSFCLACIGLFLNSLSCDVGGWSSGCGLLQMIFIFAVSGNFIFAGIAFWGTNNPEKYRGFIRFSEFALLFSIILTFLGISYLFSQ